MIVERYNGYEFELTRAAWEVKDCDGEEHGFNLCCVRTGPAKRPEDSTWTAFGKLTHAISWANGERKGWPSIDGLSEHDIINLQRLAEEAFTFKELQKWWKNGRSRS
jgi:hypothetical protein